MKNLILTSIFCFVSLTALSQTNDPKINQQNYITAHNIDQVWNSYTGSSSTRIAIHSATGFSSSHEDLQGARYLNPSSTWFDPTKGFATELVGIIGANTNNSIGMAGINWNSTIKSYNFIDTDLSSATNNFYIFEAENVDYNFSIENMNAMLDVAMQDNMDIHLFTFGVPTSKIERIFSLQYSGGFNVNDLRMIHEGPKVQTPDEIYRQQFIDAMVSMGTSLWNAITNGNTPTPPSNLELFRKKLANAAAGSGDAKLIAPVGDKYNGKNPSSILIPFSFDQYVIGVGGATINSSNTKTYWTEAGESPFIDVVAYASNIMTLSGDGFTAYNNDFNSTQASAAIVAGVVSLLTEANQSLNYDDIQNILRRTAFDIEDPGKDNKSGYGWLDAKVALDYIENNDISRESKTSSEIQTISNTSTDRNYSLKQAYRSFVSSQNRSNTQSIKAGIGTYRGRIEFDKIYTSIPDVWIRNSSTGTDISPVNATQFYEIYDKDFEIISVDKQGFVFEMKYWDARAYKSNGTALEYFTVPNMNSKRIDYTVVGDAIGELNSSNQLVISGNSSIGNNEIVEFNQAITIQPGTKITMGANSKIKFTGSVSAIGTQANPIVFKSTDPNNPNVQYDQVEFNNNYGGDNIQLEWVIFEGGYKNAHFEKISHGNSYIKNSTFRDSDYAGLYLKKVGTFTIEDVSIENNNGNGLILNNTWTNIYKSRISNNGGHGIIIIGPNQAVDISSSVIEYNGGYGISVPTDAYVELSSSRIFKNDSDEVYAYSDATLSFGHYYYLSRGNNNISDPINNYQFNGKYIYKSSLTSEGENQVSPTTLAIGNYWGTNSPMSSMFYGDVNTAGYLSSDPTTGLNPSSYPTSMDYSEPGPMLNVLNQITSAPVLKASVEKSENQGRTLKFKTMFSDMRSRMVSEPNILRKISYIRKMNAIASKDKENLRHEKNEFSRLFSLLKQNQSVQANSNELIINRETGNPRNNHLINGYLELVELEMLFNEDKFKESIQGIDELLPTAVNQDLKRSLLSLKLNANVELESYKEALNVLDEIETLEPDQDIRKGLYIPVDYSFLREDLRHQAGLEPLLDKDVKVKEPSPFNPSTNISFDLPDNSFVKIEIFDVGGRLVSTIAEKNYTSGTHSINFDASNLASGIYIVRAFLGSKKFMNKITLIK